MSLYSFETILQLTFLYGVIAIAVLFAFRVIGFPDLTPDGSVVLGAAIMGELVVRGVPVVLGLIIAAISGSLAGLITALLHTRLGISKLLSGILVMFSLYSLSLRVMGTSNLSLLEVDDWLTALMRASGFSAVLATLFIGVVIYSLALFLLRTKTGLLLRATGDSDSAIQLRGYDREPYYLLGLAFANALSAIGGATIALYQGFVDISMGTGVVVLCLTAIVMGETILRPEKVVTLLICPILGMFMYQLVLALALRSGLAPADLKISTAALALAFIAFDRLRTQHGHVGRQIGNRAF